jgi:ABC-type multidrug transport system ATPase subunit
MDIKLNNLSIGYGIFKRTEVIVDLSFDMQAGEIVILYGPNGVGKTTILRAICGQLPTEKGQILWNDRDLTKDTARRRHLTSGNFESGKMLYRYATLKENISFNTNLLRSIDLDPISFPYEYFNHGELMEKSIDEMSLGQRQKASLTCALRKPAELYFFDEPDNGLDRTSIKEFGGIVSGPPYDQSVVVIATHDSFLVQQLAQKVVFLSADRPYQVLRRKDLPADLAELDNYLCAWLGNETYEKKN